MEKTCILLILYICALQASDSEAPMPEEFQLESDDESEQTYTHYDFFFPPKEYKHYMNIIQEIDLEGYKLLKKCENDLGTPCLAKANDMSEAKIIEPSPQTLAHPVIYLPSIIYLPLHQQKVILKQYVNWYKQAYTTSLKNDSFFTQTELDHIMTLIKEIDPKKYELLLRYTAQSGEPCIRKTYNFVGNIQEPSDPTKLYPLLLIPKILLDYPLEKQKELLRLYLELYPYSSAMKQEERNIILKAIQSLAPSLYDALIAIDPSGEQHIKRYYNYNFVIYASPTDGFPVIYVGDNILNHLSFEQVQAFVAHELGHYVLMHALYNDSSGQHPSAREILTNARKREQEYEADRIEVIDFDIPIETARDAGQFFFYSSRSEPQLTAQERNRLTFKRTHPFWLNRFNHFESLRPEVELKNAHGKGKTLFNWHALADEYKKALNRKQDENQA